MGQGVTYIGRIAKHRRRSGRHFSLMGESFLQPQLLLLEQLDDRHVGRGAVQLFLDAGFKTLMLGVEGGGMRLTHMRSPVVVARVLPGSLNDVQRDSQTLVSRAQLS
jgi:hypothetical protein